MPVSQKHRWRPFMFLWNFATFVRQGNLGVIRNLRTHESVEGSWEHKQDEVFAEGNIFTSLLWQAQAANGSYVLWSVAFGFNQMSLPLSEFWSLWTQGPFVLAWKEVKIRICCHHPHQQGRSYGKWEISKASIVFNQIHRIQVNFGQGHWNTGKIPNIIFFLIQKLNTEYISIS